MYDAGRRYREDFGRTRTGDTWPSTITKYGCGQAWRDGYLSVDKEEGDDGTDKTNQEGHGRRTS